MNRKLLLAWGLIIASGVALTVAFTREDATPRYYWYSVAHTDSVRILLNANPGSRLKLEERTKNHIWVSVMRGDSAAKVAASFEVEESFPCPPICPK